MTAATPPKPKTDTAVVLLYTLAIILLVLALGFGLFVLPVFQDMLAGIGQRLSLPARLGIAASKSASWLLPLVFLRGASVDLRDRRSGKNDGTAMLTVCLILGGFLLLVLAVALEILIGVGQSEPRQGGGP